MKIEIEWLYVSSDCDTAGCSGGWAEGAVVKFEDGSSLELIPEASCFGCTNWDRDTVYKLIFEKLGHNLVEVVNSQE